MLLKTKDVKTLLDYFYSTRCGYISEEFDGDLRLLIKRLEEYQKDIRDREEYQRRRKDDLPDIRA